MELIEYSVQCLVMNYAAALPVESEMLLPGLKVEEEARAEKEKKIVLTLCDTSAFCCELTR